MAMVGRNARKPRPALDAAKLEELAIAYVGRFATSRAKLRIYLGRKLRERGWAGSNEPPIELLADRLAGLGYIDDRAYALAKARTLTGKGYGERRVRQAIMHAGIVEDDSADAFELAATEAVQAALRFARRKSIGPFAKTRPDLRERERAIGAMIRAGHAFGLAKAIVDLDPGQEPNPEELFNQS